MKTEAAADDEEEAAVEAAAAAMSAAAAGEAVKMLRDRPDKAESGRLQGSRVSYYWGPTYGYSVYIDGAAKSWRPAALEKL